MHYVIAPSLKERFVIAIDGKEERQRGCIEEAEVFLFSGRSWPLSKWLQADDLDDVRYADLAAGKKVRATAESELSEKEMK